MARGTETDADRELIEHAKRFGFTVTARMLEDWRRKGAMPSRIRVEFGRRGARYVDPPGAKDRLLGICLFLEKKGPFAERADLPRRRRIRDASIWLWYEGLAPPPQIRDRALDYWTALADELAALAERARAREPTASDGEIAVIVADEIADQVARHASAKRPLAVLARHRDDLDDDPQSALRNGYSDLFLAMQRETSADLKTLGYLLESMFIGSGMQDRPSEDPQAVRKVLKALDPAAVVRAVWNLEDNDWRDVQAFLHLSHGMVISLATHNRDPKIRRMARMTPKLSRTGELLMQIGFAAAMLPDLIEGIERRLDANGATTRVAA